MINKRKFYILYLTENIITHVVYIGVHGCDSLVDDYLGSGKRLLRAIKKYGKENFIRYNLVVSENIDYIYSLEHKIVTQDFVNSSDTYNLEIGGNKVQHSQQTKDKIGLKHKGKIISKEAREKMSKAKKGTHLLSNNNNAKKVINILTGEIFDTLKEVAEKENLIYSTFKWNIKHKHNYKYKYL